MRKIRKLFIVKKMINDIRKEFIEPNTVIDQMLILLFLNDTLDKTDIEMIDINILYRCNVSEIIKWPIEEIKKEVQRLDKINAEKYKELGVNLNEN